MADTLIRNALAMADALDDERGGADRFEAARLLRALVKRTRVTVLCGNCGRTYTKGEGEDQHGVGKCGRTPERAEP